MNTDMSGKKQAVYMELLSFLVDLDYPVDKIARIFIGRLGGPEAAVWNLVLCDIADSSFESFLKVERLSRYHQFREVLLLDIFTFWKSFLSR